MHLSTVSFASIKSRRAGGAYIPRHSVCHSREVESHNARRWLNRDVAGKKPRHVQQQGQADHLTGFGLWLAQNGPAWLRKILMGG